MGKPDFDKEAENTKFDVKAEAQKQKMAEAGTRFGANKIHGATEPNAGGKNREKGDRSG